jgi:hypothetical protein
MPPDDEGSALNVARFEPAITWLPQTPRWQQFDEAGRIHPTALAAVRAWRAGLRQ